MAVSLLSLSKSLTSANTAPGSPRPIAAPLSSVRVDIMNSAAGTPLSETSATARPIRPFSNWSRS